MRLHLARDGYDIAVVRYLVHPLDGLLLVEPDVEHAVLVYAVVQVLEDLLPELRAEVREQRPVLPLMGQPGLEDGHHVAVLPDGLVLGELVRVAEQRLHGLLQELLPLGRVAERLDPYPMEYGSRHRASPSMISVGTAA